MFKSVDGWTSDHKSNAMLPLVHKVNLLTFHRTEIRPRSLFSLVTASLTGPDDQNWFAINRPADCDEYLPYISHRSNGYLLFSNYVAKGRATGNCMKTQIMSPGVTVSN